MTIIPIIIPLNKSTEGVAKQVRTVLPEAELAATGDFKAELLNAFKADRSVIAICATGIVIRLLAAELQGKTTDPPVVVVAPDGSVVVPLLGGHHGANDLAKQLADGLQVSAAITSASDLLYDVALDDPPAGWTLANPGDVKAFLVAAMAGATIELHGEANWLQTSKLPFGGGGDLQIHVTNKPLPGDAKNLVYYPHNLAIGLGCERGTAAAEIERLIADTLSAANLTIDAVAGFFSIDIKSDEAALHEIAQTLDKPIRFFATEDLAKEHDRLLNPSDIVMSEVGVAGVAEAAALAAVGASGRLVQQKRKSKRATCAIAAAKTPIDVLRAGQPRGQLSIVGIGPGASDWRTGEATKLIRSATIIVGYGLYLDLIADLTDGKTCHAYELGEEEARVREALRLAAAGQHVALISSGDAGIFAMGSLAHELLADPDSPASWRRLKIVNAPGISAMQAASARIGAPLGHDFCAISLSDLLTPTDVIIKRVENAAAGDFVIAFYNPVSKRRRVLLAKARDILLDHRPPQTPVVIARNLGRNDERITTTQLAGLQVDDVDMLSIVIIGSTMTAAAEKGPERFIYTPRGYPLNKVKQEQ